MNVVQETLDAMRAGNYARDLPKDCFPEIVSLLEQSKDTRDRQLCYWMLGDLARLTKSPTIGNYAATRFGIEDTIKLKVEALRVASWTNGIDQYQNLLTALEHRNSQITYNAVQALGACIGEPVETALLDILRNAREPRDVGDASNAAVSLARMCSANAVSSLQTILPQIPRKKCYGSTIAAVILAFMRHTTDETTELVRREIDTTKIWNTGWAGLNYLVPVSCPEDCDRAARYLTGIFRRMRRGTEVFDYSLTRLDTDYASELVGCLAVLHKHDQSRISTFVDRIREHWKTLSIHDHDWIIEDIPSPFSDLKPHATRDA